MNAKRPTQWPSRPAEVPVLSEELNQSQTLWQMDDAAAHTRPNTSVMAPLLRRVLTLEADDFGGISPAAERGRKIGS